MLSFTRKASVHIAKQRLQEVLSSDRITCQKDLVPELKDDLYTTLSKYIDINPDVFNIQLKHSGIYIKF